LFADETTAPVLDPGRGCTKTGQLLAYASSGWLGRETPARRRALDRDPQSDQRLSAGGPGPHDPLAELRTQDAEFSGPQILARGVLCHDRWPDKEVIRV
jgi:hypothetical protein